MNKSDLIGKLDKNNLFLRCDLERSVNSILGLISNSLTDSDRIEIRNFGTFSIRHRKKRLSRNPKTGTTILVDEKRLPYFRASKFLKNALNK
jgi:integration host factor subunit beta